MISLHCLEQETRLFLLGLPPSQVSQQFVVIKLCLSLDSPYKLGTMTGCCAWSYVGRDESDRSKKILFERLLLMLHGRTGSPHARFQNIGPT